jgi:uncharacterized protein YndB with AHSA1/START domain
MEKVFEIYIKTTPERLWEALTDPETRQKYTFGAPPPAASDTQVSEPPRKLVQRMLAKWSPEVEAEGPSRITYEIEPVGTSCRLTVTHDELREGANDQLYGGWPMILSGLKTLLETGELLDTPGSLMVVEAKGDPNWSGG